MLSSVAELPMKLDTITDATHNISATYSNDSNPAESYGYVVKTDGKALSQIVHDTIGALNEDVINTANKFDIKSISGDEEWLEVNVSGTTSKTHNLLFVAIKKRYPAG